MRRPSKNCKEHLRENSSLFERHPVQGQSRHSDPAPMTSGLPISGQCPGRSACLKGASCVALHCGKTARRGGPIKSSQTCRLRRDILPHIAAGMIQLASRQMAIGIRRREFVGGLGGVVFGWPLAANAQQPNRARKLGILMPLAENDPESQRRIAALLQMLRQFGWVDGKTIVIETRFAGGNPESLPTLASELVRAKVDVIVTQGAQPVEALRAATTTIPIVMASVGDALGAGYVASLAHPGGNITGLDQRTFADNLADSCAFERERRGTPPTTEGDGAISRYARPLVAVAASAESRRH